jgi:hypothetical protein
MLTQLALTLTSPPPAPSRGPERGRLSRQNTAILARLEQGHASNHELAQLSLKYTSRLSEIRQAGYPVRIVSRDYETGRVVYALGV